MTISDLLSSLPSFRQHRTAEEVNAHLVKLKFSEQLVIYLRETKRQLTGPLTHMAPEVNGVYLERELEHARTRRHKIVHESEKVDYEHDGPILRIMETMSWLHGWLREDLWNTDPTPSVWHSPNKQMRDVFLFEPLADELGLGIATPEPFITDGPIVLIQDVHKMQLVRAAAKESLDMAYCIAWAFQALREPIKDGRRLKKYTGVFERYWFREGSDSRPVFLINLPDVFSEQTINAVACRVLLLRNKHKECGTPLIVVNHLSQLGDRERMGLDCVAVDFIPVVCDLEFTVISLMDWISYVCLLTLDNSRDFGFRSAIRKSGLVRFAPPLLTEVGYVRRVFPEPSVVSLVVEREWLSVGDEICIQNENDTRLAIVESLEIKRVAHSTVFAESIVGAKLNISIRDIRNDSIVYRVLRRRLTHDLSVAKTVQLKVVDHSQWLAKIGQFPGSITGFGTYGGDAPIE